MDKRLKEYAGLAVRMGANLQAGDTLLLRTPVECAEFARLIVEEAYAAGAKEVVVNWNDDVIGRLKYLYAADEVFDSFHEWEKMQYDALSKDKFVLLTIYAEDPEILSGVDPDRIQRYASVRHKALKEFNDKMMCSEYSWSIVSVPIPSWAKKVFPDREEAEAMEALWNAIYETMRIDGSGDALEKWRQHTARLKERCEKLNRLNIRKLHYSSGLGTDFSVTLAENNLWMGGSDKNGKGIPFVANMPTEEIFTAPDKYGGNGILVASRPLCLNGFLVKDIRFTIEDGKIVKAEASEGQEILEKVLDMDEGSRYLGELALVENDSPISNQNLLYYNTLFDENASCHIAFGAAYPECVKGGTEVPAEELEKIGLNDSLNHEDFMVGTADMQITGEAADGSRIPIFTDGNFAF